MIALALLAAVLVLAQPLLLIVVFLLWNALSGSLYGGLD